MESSTHSRSHSTSYIRDEAPHPLAKACDQCHRCKVACDGGRPTCDRCGKNGSACTYSTGKPIGKPKGSKNRSKLETQRTATNKIDPAPSMQLVASDSSGKRKTNAGASPGAHQVVNHKRQRSSVCLPSPTSPNERVLGYVGEPELSSGTSISSVHAEQLALQSGHAASAYSVPTPEFLKLQLSPVHPTGHELDASFDHDIDFTHDWMSSMVNDRNAELDAFIPALEQPSFTPPSLPPAGSHGSNEIARSKTPIDSPQDASHGECTCTAESLVIIPELQQYSTGHTKIPVDGVLRLTRRGFSAISNHIDCPHHARANAAQTSLLACILILMQVAACYSFLRSSMEDPEYQKQLLVSVGGLTIEEDETRRHVVNAVLDAEVRQALILSTRLENWGVQLQSGSSGIPCELLLSSVRQKLDSELEQRGLV
ncbi:hypothetical protein B0J11DRAFT_575009 [Dendryphion nanum]|uniref:Zn(2)-C6 fungal-type domain-containing protein n=1 Tax=Dendryphion nanum TaxID=256645 RepID=A0A9P9EJN7_9PLEO|nr:hypothetical protein B0J11DRAFT_575009 [Dendryphion nanum]